MAIYLLLARSAPARSRRCSDGDRGRARFLIKARHGHRAGVPLRAARSSSCSTRSTTSVGAEVADRGVHDEVVRARPGDEPRRPRGARRTRSIVASIATLARARPRERSPRSPSTGSGSSGGTRSRSSSCCRSRCPGIVTAIALNASINNVRHPVQPVDDHDRPRDLLHRGRLQQRDRAAAPDARPRSSRRRWTSGPTGGRPSGYVTFPAIRTAIVAGALLAFALSFDEIVVTNFIVGHRAHDPEVHLQQPAAAAGTARSSTSSRSVVMVADR